MRTTLLIVFIFSAFHLFACPACNIHNYLSSSVHSATQIFVAEVVGNTEYSTAKLRVIKILKDDTSPLPFADDYYLLGGDTIRNTFHKFPNTRDSSVIENNIIEYHLYNAKEKIGDTYIFMNPVSMGATFSLVYESATREIELLIAGESITNTEDALVMLNGISIESVQMAKQYFDQNHGRVIFDDLKTLIKAAETDPAVEFGDHRVQSHINTLIELDPNQYTDSIIQLLSKANFEAHFSHFRKDDPSLGKTVLGAAFRYSIEANKEYPKLQQKLIEELEQLIESEIKYASVYAAYGLAFVDDYKWKKTTVNLSSSQKQEVSLGIYWAGLWLRMWYRKDELEKLRPLIIELDPKLTDKVEERLTFNH